MQHEFICFLVRITALTKKKGSTTALKYGLKIIHKCIQVRFVLVIADLQNVEVTIYILLMKYIERRHNH